MAMAKDQRIEAELLSRVMRALEEARDAGNPVACSTEEDAAIAIRRWQSFARRGLSPDDVPRRVLDLAKGIGKKRDPIDFASQGHGLHADYVDLAERIAEALSRGDNRGEL